MTRRRRDDVIILLTGIVSSVICVGGYTLLTSGVDADILSGLLLMIFGVALFCGVAFGYYRTPRPKGGRTNYPAPTPGQIRAVTGSLPKNKPAGEKVVSIAASLSAASPSSPTAEPLPPPPGPASNADEGALEAAITPTEHKADVAQSDGEANELAAAHELIKVYTQLLNKVKEPSKQKTLKRWIAQQEDLVKAHQAAEAKRA